MSVETKLNELNLVDVGIFRHGFTPYMRDYFLEYEVGGTTSQAGRYLCLFTHCVVAHIETRVGHDIWRKSWNNEFIDYQAWQDAGEPDGFVWGANWSLAYPGLEYIRNSKLAASWSERLKKEMHEVILETEAFGVQLIFHHVKVEKLSSDVGMINKVIFPLK
jgi:hypothetical protein